MRWVWLFLLLLLCGCTEKERVVPAKSLHRFVEGTVLSATLSKDSTLAAILTDDQRLGIWDTESKKRLHLWDKTQLGAEKSYIALSGDKKRLCVAGQWSAVMLNVVDGSIITSWDVQGFNAGATVSALDIDQTGHKVLVGMSDGAVLSVDLKSQKALKLDHHKNQITRLAYASDNKHAVSGSTDKNFAFWRADNGYIVHQHDFRSRVTALVLDPHSNLLFVSDALNSHWIVDSRSGNKLAELDFFERFRYFRHGYFLQRGDYLVTSSPKSELTLWHSATGRELITWQISQFSANATVLSLAKNHAGDLVTLSSDGAMQVWDYRPFC